MNSLQIFTDWFQIQKEFTMPFEEISLQELNKCLQKIICRQENLTAVWSLHANIVIVGNSNYK